jgi:arsenate reductase
VTTIVFVCVQNAGRSQMAAALFNAMAHPSCARALSAGTQPAARVHEHVVTVMRERNIDLSAAVPQKLAPEILDGAQWVVTMGCGDHPAASGVRRDEWTIADPEGRTLDEVRAIRDELEELVWRVIVREGWVRLQPRALSAERAPKPRRG